MTFVTDRGAEQFLKDRGFRINNGVVILDRDPVGEDEKGAISYLCGEWNFAALYPGELIRKIEDKGVVG